MPQYRYLLADALTDEIRDEVPLTDVTFSHVLNRAGTFQGTAPLRLTRTIRSTRPYAQTVLADDPWAYYRMEEASGSTAQDATDNNRDALYGGAYTQSAQGLVGDATRGVRFQGTATGASLNASTLPPTGLTDAWSAETWFQVDGVPEALAGQTVCLIGFFFSGTFGTASLMVALMQPSAAGVDEGKVYLISLNGAGAATIGSLSALAYNDGQPHHLVMKGDGTGLVTLWVDGEAVTSLTRSGAFTAPNVCVFGGISGAGGALAMRDGIVDEAALYDQALSDERIQAHHASGTGTLEQAETEYLVTSRSNIDPGRTAIYVERDGVIVWGGLLWTADPDTEAGTLTLNGAGFWSYLYGRRIRETKTYAAVEQQAVARDLMTYALAKTGSIPMTLAAAPASSGILRDRSYPAWERKEVAEAVEQMAEVIDGFDFDVTVAWEPGGTIAKEFTTYYPQKGSRGRLLWVKPEPGESGGNLLKVRAPTDATKMATLVDAIGQGEGSGMLIATAQDPALLATYPLLEGRYDYKTVKKLSTLREHAEGDLARDRQPIQQVSALVRPDHPDTALGSWSTGDVVSLRVTDGWLTLDGPWRIVAYSVKPATSGEAEEIEATLVKEAMT